MGNHMTIGGRIFLTLMGGILVLTGLGFAWGLYHYAFLRAEITRHWTETPCTITASGIVEGQFSENSPVTWGSGLEYRYQFNGTFWTGTHIRRIEGATPHRERAEGKQAKYPPGLQTVCYVNPANPSEAVLEHDTRAAIYTVWWPLLFAVGGAGMVWSAWFRRREPTVWPAG